MPWSQLTEANAAPDRLIACVWGEPKSGKTTFALSFPDPIFYFNMDWGLDHHIRGLLAAGREIYKADYLSIEPELSESQAELMLKGFEQDYSKALKEGRQRGGGTIILDTSTQLWQLASKVFLDDIKKKRKEGQIYPFDYASANAYFQNLINQVKVGPMNMVMVQRAKEKYGPNGQPTGVMEIQGNNQVPYLAGMVLHMQKNGENHTGTIDASWDSSKLVGVELSNPTYQAVTQLIEVFNASSTRNQAEGDPPSNTDQEHLPSPSVPNH